MQKLWEGGFLAGDWQLDPGKSRIYFTTKAMWGLVIVRGSFGDLSGKASVWGGGQATGTVTVAAGSIDTKNVRRDKHLRSPAFLDSASTPNITFTTNTLRLVGSRVVRIEGDLTVRDHTNAVSFDAKVSLSSGGDEGVRLDTEVVIDRSHFGLTWNRFHMASMETSIDIHLVFIRA
jgi:polyisoprenoid-binding protein YceI